MKALNAGTIAKMVKGRLEGSSEIIVNKISIDTRTLEKGSLFVAIRGERFDGRPYRASRIKRCSAGYGARGNNSSRKFLPYL